jgi:hypothetical protein
VHLLKVEGIERQSPVDRSDKNQQFKVLRAGNKAKIIHFYARLPIES